MKIDRIIYKGELPDSFFSIPDAIYSNLPYRPEENRYSLERVFALESTSTEVIIYTDHHNVRLAAIFPNDNDTTLLGFWETTDDLSVNKEAFSLLEKDAKEKGRTKVVGPINFNTFHHYRLRTTGDRGGPCLTVSL
jgi:hypothetical protein